LVVGDSIITKGGDAFEYPDPGLLIDIKLTLPEDKVAVAIAVTPFSGDAIITEGSCKYPDPPSTTSIEVIVPDCYTIAVEIAHFFSESSIISILLINSLLAGFSFL